MIDIGIGGITEWVKAAKLVQAQGVPVVSHLATEVLAHAVAAQPNGLIVEYWPPARPLFEEAPRVEDGNPVLSSRPGLGLTLDEKAMQHYATV